MDQQEYLKQQAVEFIVALGSPTLTVREIAWEGAQAALALYTVNGDIAALQRAITRLKDLVAAK